MGGFGSYNTPILLNSVLSLSLTSGSVYWVTVATTTNNAVSWNFKNTLDPNNTATSFDGASTWFAPSGLTPGAFQVNGTTSSGVPEPGSILTFVSGALALFTVRKFAIK